SPQPEPLPGLRSRLNSGFDLSVYRWNFDGGSQRRLPRSDGNLDADVISVHREHRMRLHAQPHEEVSGLALTLYLDHRPVPRAGRDVDVKRARDHDVTRASTRVADCSI